MYVDPFLMGVICTVLAEVAGIIVLAIWCNKKTKRRKENESTDNTN